MSQTISRRGVIGAVGATALGAIVSRSGGAASATPPAARLPCRILLRAGLSDQHVGAIRALSPQIEISRDVDVKDANVVFGNISTDEFKSTRNLRWVQCPSAGVEHLLSPEFAASDVILTNAQGCYAPEIAEHAFGLLFALTRGIASQARKRQWGYEGEPIELRGRTMGIIGLGGIGREVARRAKAMDMQVIAVDAEPMLAERFAMADEVRLVDDGLDDLLKRSDVVISCAPHTPKSRGMLGADQFVAMKRGAYFLNVSRGKIVNTDALLAALKSGQLAGAGLDVTDPEPLPQDHELWRMENVMITSHIAGKSQISWSRVQKVFADNVSRYIRNLPMLSMVDKQKGY